MADDQTSHAGLPSPGNGTCLDGAAVSGEQEENRQQKECQDDGRGDRFPKLVHRAENHTDGCLVRPWRQHA